MKIERAEIRSWNLSEEQLVENTKEEIEFIV